MIALKLFWLSPDNTVSASSDLGKELKSTTIAPGYRLRSIENENLVTRLGGISDQGFVRDRNQMQGRYPICVSALTAQTQRIIIVGSPVTLYPPDNDHCVS
jgi:hypothetical protein